MAKNTNFEKIIAQQRVDDLRATTQNNIAVDAIEKCLMIKFIVTFVTKTRF